MLIHPLIALIALIPTTARACSNPTTVLTMPQTYNKAFIPLESNPDVFNELIALLGVPPSLHFEDVFTLDDPAALPPRILALVLVFPTTPAYEARLTAEEAGAKDWMAGQHDEEDEDAVWFKQTINNACGLYAVLHALANGRAKDFLRPGSLLDNLLSITAPMDPAQAALVLEGSQELEDAYASIATKGDTAAPASAEDDVNFHYICFVKSPDTGHLYELDGDRKGPVDRGIPDEEERVDLGAKSLDLVRQFIARGGDNIGFNLMALADSS
ncbi:ubiquitin carboxyl-terminal hydrolase, family 1 [Colletotrichum higginsianum]|uniref:Ubiquitin carboxyl-terminal hydrolase n=2 Tax=Colletotrichum higginsianum TaxID=80884 RepID=H1V6B5_COLHI|nr:Ubiquitin carboxyl-terminal hydrolase [Colletotrichum higginsianum IMI 349063]OBR14761.1 Ubiquitin carboxyl-terminal hydrolase [Colletotrichum higginsianum IMI 349063]TID02328.1 Ubiquitin carboxyl-terminal hydrolase isozyme L3 [Colletotrichum higginsianum]CCF35767.1 ubiquitin carboxyl-terminal hydrolase, family 1 [Colletotrichum higginsianum]